MEGIATLMEMEHETLPSTHSEATAPNAQNFAVNVKRAIQDYFIQLGGQDPTDLYEKVLREMEGPLLKIIMRFTAGNQSKAAHLLGLSRGTLRKKLGEHTQD